MNYLAKVVKDKFYIILKLINKDCQVSWKASEEQIETIIIPAMKHIAEQCACYGEKLQCPPGFIAVMLRDIADAFEEESPEGENSCVCC